VSVWLIKGVLTSEETAMLSDYLSKLARFYHTHIHVEDQFIFKQARQLLNEEELKKIGSEMAARRNIKTA
jgi:hemerythrin-like domain-containing protein